MIKRAKGLELVKFFFIIYLNTFGSKVLKLTLKIMNFESVPLTKVHVYVIEGMNV
jgi:hypothetical protein